MLSVRVLLCEPDCPEDSCVLYDNDRPGQDDLDDDDRDEGQCDEEGAQGGVRV